jgi:hypothetical protein
MWWGRNVRRCRTAVGWWTGTLCLLLVAGCARSPGGGNAQPARQLLLQMTVAGRIQPNLFYYIALDVTGDQSRGPLPVVGPPWGNGFATGQITHFVRIQGGQAEVFQILANTNLLQYESLGRPFDFRPPQGTGTFGVTLDMDTLVPSATALTNLNVNMIATDTVPLDPQFPGPKLVDAFGTVGNSFLTIPVFSSRVFTNRDFPTPLEPANDVLRAPSLSTVDAPDLDIVDWRIEVLRQ